MNTPAPQVRCPRCNGTGEVSRQPLADPQSRVEETCPDCEGTCRVALTAAACVLEAEALREAIWLNGRRYGEREHGVWDDLADTCAQAVEVAPLADVWAVLEEIGNAEPRWAQPVPAELQARVEAWFSAKEAA